MKLSESVKFIRAFFLSLSLCCVTYLLLFYLQFGASVVAEWWVRDVYWVKDSIAKNIHDRKVVIISGSNALFGLDGEILEKKIGLPVVNMAGHGGLDLDFYKFKIDQIVESGDIVIMPLEPEYYSRNEPYSEWFLDNMMAWGKDYFLSLSLLDAIKFVVHTDPERVIEGIKVKLSRKKIDARKDYSKEAVLLSAKKTWDGDAPVWSGYSYKSIDKHGGVNVVGGPTRNARYEISSYRSYFHDVHLSRYFLEKYSEIRALTLEKGASLYLIWSVTGKNKRFNLFDSGEQQRIIAFASQLQKEGIDIYCNPASFYFHQDFFYNTGYHLNTMGSIIRTENLAGCVSDIDNNIFRGTYDFTTVLQKVQQQEIEVKKSRETVR